MQTVIQEAKRTLRREVQERLRNLSPAQRAMASQRACELIHRQDIWRAAKSVVLYAPMAAELDVWSLLERALEDGKAVALPRYEPRTDDYVICRIKDPGSEVQTGHWGIREPVAGCQPISTNRLDLIMVPGVAFDAHGRRIGRGKGYYDRILSAVHGTRCGVGFDEQIVPEVPVEPHDVVLNCILTPTRWLEVRPPLVLE